MGVNPATFVGIEGGATKTIALVADSAGRIIERRQFPALNLKLATDRQILAVLRQFHPTRAAICLAGCRTEADRRRLRALAARAWPRATVFAGNDLDSGLAVAFSPTGDGILIISGTGSCVIGRRKGRMARSGGWGHLLGDQGSGYWIALTGLRAAIREYDRRETFPSRILRRLCLNSPDQLVDWMQRAGKGDIASLAGEFMTPGLMLQASSFLAQDCHAVAQKLGLKKPRVALSGGVLRHERRFASLVTRRIRTMLPGAQVKVLRRDPSEGALLLAMECADLPALSPRNETAQRRRVGALQITEQRNPRTMDLDGRTVSQLVDTMLSEESRVIPALRKNKGAIVHAIETIVRAFRRGGRLFYVGAGTSGRLGVLDASECPPTFSADPEMVHGIIAGGVTALHSAIEAGEDDGPAGAEAIRHRGVGGKDVVVGIAASGTTPFVIGALDEAKRRGAKTFLLSFSPSRFTDHVSLFFATGPEVLTGSTRLKAGTATKLVLNMLTTVSMIRLGKVVSNLMVDVKPSNEKLRARACRIVAELAGCDVSEARERLERAHWNLKKAVAACQQERHRRVQDG